MAQVNIAGFVEAVQAAPSFSLPQMDGGTSYLFNRVYKKMANGETVTLSELDFSAFDEEDINSLSGLYDEVFGRNNFQADRITYVLQKAVPICNASAYI